MMDRRRKDSVEIQAISVDEAVRLALEQLGRTREEVDIEILAEPSNTGDLEAEEALVRVTVRGYASQPAALSRTGGLSRPMTGGAAVATTIREPDENDAVAIAVTAELLGVMGFQAQVVPAPTSGSFDDEADAPPTIALNIVGDDLGMLIGRRGEHLAQLQYLVNLLVNRRLGHWIRITLDVEGYKRRREESLIGLADRVARQVARSGRPIPLEPMPANERRIIHLALRNDPEVMTESNGEGDLRRVVIQPKA
jgi:spoIIIJ-associated protein